MYYQVPVKGLPDISNSGFSHAWYLMDNVNAFKRPATLILNLTEREELKRFLIQRMAFIKVNEAGISDTKLTLDANNLCFLCWKLAQDLTSFMAWQKQLSCHSQFKIQVEGVPDTKEELDRPELYMDV